MAKEAASTGASTDAAGYVVRRAVEADIPKLGRLIATSIRGLGAADYTPAQIDAALMGAFGVDSQLIADGTYFVVVAPFEEIVACGGFSFRGTLFGSDTASVRDASRLDPTVDAARIRAFFVHPAHARRGLGSRLLWESEAAARALGFSAFQLMATLPGTRLYRARGYVGESIVEHPLPGGERIRFVPMRKVDPRP